jgi:hypothetical protein
LTKGHPDVALRDERQLDTTIMGPGVAMTTVELRTCIEVTRAEGTDEDGHERISATREVRPVLCI